MVNELLAIAPFQMPSTCYTENTHFLHLFVLIILIEVSKLGAAIGQRIRLRLPSIQPAAQDSNPKHYIYAFSILFLICILNFSSYCEQDENKKEAGVGPFLKTNKRWSGVLFVKGIMHQYRRKWLNPFSLSCSD